MTKQTVAVALLAVALATPGYAEVWLGADAPLAVAISDGQRGVFRPGLLPSGGIYVGRGPLAVGLRMRAGFLRDGGATATDREDPSTGGLFSTTLAARLNVRGVWFEATAGGGITGTTFAPTFELAAGISFTNERFELGPSARYVQVRSTDSMDSFGTAELLLVGLDVRFGGKPQRVRQVIAAAPRREPAIEAPVVAIDRDDDVVVDLDASCAHDLTACPLPEGMEILHDRIILDERVLFDFGRARVRTHGRKLVRTIVELWKMNAGWERITIEGHADTRGTDDYNRALSERRAQRVRELMVELGSDAVQVEAVGLGKSRPRDTGHDDRAHQRNRRVEFVIDRRMP